MKMKINHKNLFFVTLVFGIFFFMITVVIADLSDVQYPIIELGNCGSEDACKTYCDDTNNIELCLNFAEKNNLMSIEEIKEARKVLPFLKAGTTPGGCKNKENCLAYCDDESHSNECIEFAHKAGFISDDDYEIAKLTGGKGPGGCRREACRTYCNDPIHMEECMEFAIQYNLIPPGETEEVRKIIQYLKKGGQMPGGCTSEKDCRAYCDNSNNNNECMRFALEAGFITGEDAKVVRKMLELGLNPPGNCRSKEDCDAYCNNPINFNECIEFAYKIGFISGPVYELAKKFGGGGPGGCRGKEECEAYCQNINNQDECLDFAVKHGFISEEDYQLAKKGIEQKEQILQPPESEETPQLASESEETPQPASESSETSSEPTVIIASSETNPEITGSVITSVESKSYLKILIEKLLG